MVGLEADGETAREALRVPECRHDPALLRDKDQVLVTHEFRDGRDHLGREARAEGGQEGAVGLVAQEPVPEFPHGEGRDRRERRGVVRIDDKAADLVGLVGHERVLKEPPKRDLGQAVLGGDPLLGGGRGDARQHVARAMRGGFRHQLAQRAERVAAAANVAGPGWHRLDERKLNACRLAISAERFRVKSR